MSGDEFKNIRKRNTLEVEHNGSGTERNVVLHTCLVVCFGEKMRI